MELNKLVERKKFFCPGGEEIAKKEKDKIFDAISQVEEKIAKLKLSIK